MPMHYALGNPGMTSLSVDGIEHKVNADGVLEVHAFSPGLKKALAEHGCRAIDPTDKVAMDEMRANSEMDETERQTLFTKLDAVGPKVDRRRSLKQLRGMWADYSERQARTSGASAVLNESIR
jgi:hypothetical protein